MQDRAVLFIRRLQNYEELRVLQRTICLRNRRKLSELALVDNARGVWSIACNGGAFAKVFSIVWIQKQCQQLSTAKIPVWQNSIVPSDSCKAELNSAPSIRSTVAYQYYLLCIPFRRVQNRRTAQGLGRGEGENVRGTAATVKRATKTCNLFCIAAKRVEKRCCACYHPGIKPVSQHIRSREYWPTSYTGVASLAAKQVCLGPVKRTTCAHCCKTRSYCLLFARTFRNLKQTHLLQDRFDSWVVTCATSLFNLLCNSEAKQVPRFCCLFHRTFTTEITTLLAIKINK